MMILSWRGLSFLVFFFESWWQLIWITFEKISFRNRNTRRQYGVELWYLNYWSQAGEKVISFLLNFTCSTMCVCVCVCVCIIVQWINKTTDNDYTPLWNSDCFNLTSLCTCINNSAQFIHHSLNKTGSQSSCYHQAMFH